MRCGIGGGDADKVIPEGMDPFEYIAARTTEIVGNATVVVNSYDPDSDTTTVRAVVGLKLCCERSHDPQA